MSCDWPASGGLCAQCANVASYSRWLIVQNLISRESILLFSTLRNEKICLPFFLRYYRDLGVNHFLFVDNGSDDGGREYLAQQPDVSVWTTGASYKRGLRR